MLRLLYKYLILNKKVSITGLGLFYIERKPATLDFANKVFVAPALQISFNSKMPDADNRIYTFISKEEKIDETEAAIRYNNFISELKEYLYKNQIAELPEIGTLSQNAEGQLFFKATKQLNNYFPHANAERVLRENTEHHILVGDNSRTNVQMKEMLVEEVQHTSPAKDNWWIFAIGLGIIGIATIVYYYLHNGSLH